MLNCSVNSVIRIQSISIKDTLAENITFYLYKGSKIWHRDNVAYIFIVSKNFKDLVPLDKTLTKKVFFAIK